MDALMPTTEQQRRAIAYLTKGLRETTYGATKFDEPGIMAALSKVQHLDVGTVTMAAMRCAADPSIKTPAMIGNPSSSVYVERVGPERARRHPTPETACRTCGRDVTTCGCDNPTTRPLERDPDWYTTQAAEARALLHGMTDTIHSPRIRVGRNESEAR
jgi:hypothetical protein